MFEHVPPQYPKSTPCKIAFVGEAPSDEELEKGIPLVGPAGRVFNAILRTAGMDREEYMVTNVFDVQLPGNNIANWCGTAGERAKWENYQLPPVAGGYLRPEYKPHLSRLASELGKVKPTLIVPMGGTALWAFTGEDAISKARGAVGIASRIAPGVKILPTFHPSFVQRQWKFFHVVVKDFLKAARQAEFPEVRPPKRAIYIPEDKRDLAHIKVECAEADLLSVDIETGWGQITCIGFAPSAEVAYTVPFVDFRKPNHCHWDTLEEELLAWGIVKDIMESEVPKLGQNFLYDAYWLWAKYAIKAVNYCEDTRLCHHALFPEMPKSLGFMGAAYTEQGAWKLMTRRKGGKEDE